MNRKKGFSTNKGIKIIAPLHIHLNKVVSSISVKNPSLTHIMGLAKIATEESVKNPTLTHVVSMSKLNDGSVFEPTSIADAP